MARPTAAWLTLFEAADVPAAICHTLETLTDDPHLRAVGLLVEEAHPQEGAIHSIRPTVLWEGEPAPTGAPARPLGADTAAVLREAGLSEAEVEALVAGGATRSPQSP